jgi:uroporphyrinogen decarboxylase
VKPFLSSEVKPDWEGLRASITCEKQPERVHHIELFIDGEVQADLAKRFDLFEGLDPSSASYEWELQIRLHRLLGYDYIRCGVEGVDMPMKRAAVADTAGLARESGRSYVDENTGPITNWEEFEEYPWPDPAAITTRALEWHQENLPDDMCIIGGGGFAHFAEHLTWLMGYATLCTALFEQRELVEAIRDRLMKVYIASVDAILQFDRVKLIWGSDDMGYRGGPLISPQDMRELVLRGHKEMARRSHEAGRPYLLHSCGNLDSIMDDLIHEVGIDAKHSFEDTIEDVRDVKTTYGREIALLGGIDLDFLCRASEEEVRARVRDTLEVCWPGGGYCLGTGNSVANYVPVDNYLAMLDEGRRFAA